MATIEQLLKSFTFTSGQNILSAQVNQDFDELVSKVNEVSTWIADTSAADMVKLAALLATAIELNYVKDVTSAIQTQLDAKEDADTDILKADTADSLTAGFSVTETPLSGTSITPDFEERNVWTLTTSGNTTFNNPDNKDAGTWIIFASAGAHTLTLDTDYDIVYGVWTQSVTNIVTLVSDGTTVYVYFDQP